MSKSVSIRSQFGSGSERIRSEFGSGSGSMRSEFGSGSRVRVRSKFGIGRTEEL